MALNTLTGGAFQDMNGTVLANGYLIFELSHDEQETATSPSGQVVGGLKKKILLDANGNAATGSQLWSNDVLVPANSFYIVTAYRSDGASAWKSPQSWTIPSSPSPFNLGTLVPTNPPSGGSSGGGSLTLQTNSVNNSSQNLLNLVNGTNTSLTDLGGGSIQINANPPSLFQSHGWSYIDIAGSTNIASVVPYAESPVDQLNSGAASIVNATATEPAYHQFSTGATANLDNGVQGGAGSSQSHAMVLGILSSFSTRVLIGNTTSVLYWIGMSDGANPLGAGATYATGTPNTNFVGFRYLAGTDTHWQCVCQTSSSNHTYVDSGVNPQTTTGVRFQIIIVGGGSSVQFYIGGNLVGTISTNLPATTTFFKTIHDVVGLTASTCTMAVAYSFWTVRDP